MNLKISLIWLFAMSLFFMGCQHEAKMPHYDTQSKLNSNPADSLLPNTSSRKTIENDVYTQAAIETCKCIQPMLDKAKHLKELESNRQTTDMKRVASEMAEIQPQVQKCSDAIRQKYGKINHSINNQRILNALAIECPDMAMLFSNLSKVAKN